MAEESSSSALDIVLHPAAIVSITDHFTRIRSNTKVAKPRVVGGLVGTQAGRTLEIHSSYQILSSEDEEGRVVLDMEFLQKKLKLITDVQPEFQFLGWYSTGSEACEADMAVQNLLREQGINESPLYLVLDPVPPLGTKELPVSLYESELRIVNETPTYMFVRSSFSIYSGESERVAVDHVAHLSSVATAESSSSVVTHFGGLGNAVENLEQRLRLLLRYLSGVATGAYPREPKLLRMVKAVMQQLPVSDGSSVAAQEEFLSQANDALLTTYLAALTKAANAVNDVVEKFNVIQDARTPAARFALSGPGVFS